MTKNKVLITGGSGMIGMELSQLLESHGYQIVHLSRNPSGAEPYSTYSWDIGKGEIDERVFDGVSHIIHLAGAGVADKRWTSERKEVIIDSRVKSANLLYDYTKKLGLKLDAYISASGISIYGDTGNEWVDEDSSEGEGFLADVVKKWEDSADQFASLTKVAKVRIGVVLSEKGGALVEMAKPVRFFVGAPLGSGRQYMSWIHLEDLVGLFAHLLKVNHEGTFNAVAPNPVTNTELTKAIASALGRPLILPNVPAFVMKIILGEMATMVLEGSRVSCNKVQVAGYEFQYSEVQMAVQQLLA